MIIVEGADGSGKSAIIERLATITNMAVYHRGGPPPTKEVALEQIAKTFTQRGMILDRTIFVSELVYGRVMRGETIVEEEMLWDGLRRLIDMDAVFIFCRPPNRILWRCFQESIERPKAWKPPEHCDSVKQYYEKIVDAYDGIYETLQKMGAKLMKYEWMKKGY